MSDLTLNFAVYLLHNLLVMVTSFVSLPREIRDQVYHLALAKKPDLCWQLDDIHPTRSPDFRVLHSAADALCDPRYSNVMIAMEASQVFFSINAFLILNHKVVKRRLVAVARTCLRGQAMTQWITDLEFVYTINHLRRRELDAKFDSIGAMPNMKVLKFSFHHQTAGFDSLSPKSYWFSAQDLNLLRAFNAKSTVLAGRLQASSHLEVFCRLHLPPALGLRWECPDFTQLKTILDLWLGVHKDHEDRYLVHVAEKDLEEKTCYRTLALVDGGMRITYEPQNKQTIARYRVLRRRLSFEKGRLACIRVLF